MASDIQHALPLRTAARALIEVGGRVLAVRYEDKSGEFFALPGGAQQPGEDLRAALVRECEEETCLPVTVHELLWVREIITPNHPGHSLPVETHQIEFIFRCTIDGDHQVRPGACPDPNQIDVLWLPVEKLSRVRFFPRALAPFLSAMNKDPPGVYLGDVP